MTTRTKTILKIVPDISASSQKLFSQNQNQSCYHFKTVLFENRWAGLSNQSTEMKHNTMYTQSRFPTTEINRKESAYV